MFVESCYDCESLNISYRFIRVDDDTDVYEAICRDCGANWELDEPLEDDSRN